MKKILALTLSVLMVLSLASCSLLSSDKGEQSGETPEISRGTIKSDVYTSEYLGFSFTKPESWIYSTDEEIAAIINLGADMYLNENFKDVLENNPTVYDMMARDTLTGSNILVGFENLTKSFATNITVEQYIQAVKAQFENISTLTVVFSDSLETVKLGKTEFTKLVCTTTTAGTSMKQVYYLNKSGNYMQLVIVTIPSGYTVEQIEAMFQ